MYGLRLSPRHLLPRRTRLGFAADDEMAAEAPLGRKRQERIRLLHRVAERRVDGVEVRVTPLAEDFVVDR